MNENLRKWVHLASWLILVLCLWKGTQAALNSDRDPQNGRSVNGERVKSTPIQDLTPGMRVIGRNPLESDAERGLPEPDPATWRLLTVKMEHKPGEFVEAQLLRPLDWMEINGAEVGESIWLELPEMQAAGEAEVLLVAACPEIKPGMGPIITGTFKHLADDVVSVYVDGSNEPIGCTSEHPFWSETRQEFVPAIKLEPSESVLTAYGNTARITSIIPRAGPATVYGLEVYGEHVYHVGDIGLLAHNASQVTQRGVAGHIEGPKTAKASDIRWTHDDVAWRTRPDPDGDFPATDLFTLSQLAEQGKLRDPVLDVVLHEGKYYSINNRRLAAYKMSSLEDVPIRIRSLDDSYWAQKFRSSFTSYEHNGTIVKLRGTGNRTTPRMFMDLEGNIHRGQ